MGNAGAVPPNVRPRRKRSVISSAIAVLALAVIGFIAAASYLSARTIRDLLTENKKLREALSRLTQEDQIGYAKVISQERIDGKLYTRLKFVETARDNKLDIVLEKEYTVEGDIVHFDALIVKFSSQLVMDGKERALYLWRRVYGDDMPPRDGYAIEEAGEEPERYADLLDKLSLKDRETFWTEIWKLANTPGALSELGVQAIYGNAVYSRLKPGLIYVFRIGGTGQVFPETVPDM